MCQHDASPDARRGARLEDGAEVHAHDHALWTRRDVLQRLGLGAVGASFLAGSTPIGVFGRAPVLDALARLETDRVLVLVQLSGGNDGLNTVVPVDNGVYQQRRTVTSAGVRLPTPLAIDKAAALPLSTGGSASDWRLHPALAPLVPLWDDGRMAIVHAVGYGGQSRSHFDGIDNWMTASGTGTTMDDGWAGRFLLNELDPGETADAYRTEPPALNLGSAARLFDSAQGNLSIGRLDLTANVRTLTQKGVVYPLDGLPEGEPFTAAVSYLRQSINVALAYVVKFADATTKAPNLAAYPSDTSQARGLAAQLSLAARVIRGGLSPRILSVTLGGFDTHAAQAVAGANTTGTHATLLKALADNLAAFFADLRADGLDRRVVAMTFSEFGRTLAANASGGTDHGSGAPAMLFGPAVEAGFFGTAPTLTNDLDRSAVGPTTDYRSLYATLLERWFRVPAPEVDLLLGRSAPRLGMLAPALATSADAPGTLPSGDALLAPAPNPFDARTRLRVRLVATGAALLQVFDPLGRRVAVLHDGPLPAGDSDFQLDGAPLAPGLYLLRLDTPRGSTSRPVVRVH